MQRPTGICPGIPDGQYTTVPYLLKCDAPDIKAISEAF